MLDEGIKLFWAGVSVRTLVCGQAEGQGGRPMHARGGQPKDLQVLKKNSGCLGGNDLMRKWSN